MLNLVKGLITRHWINNGSPRSKGHSQEQQRNRTLTFQQFSLKLFESNYLNKMRRIDTNGSEITRFDENLASPFRLQHTTHWIELNKCKGKTAVIKTRRDEPKPNR